MSTVITMLLLLAPMISVEAQAPGCGDCYQWHDDEIGKFYHCFGGGALGEECSGTYQGQFDCDEGELGPTWCHSGAHDTTCSKHHWDCPAQSDKLLDDVYEALDQSDYESIRTIAADEDRVNLSEERGIVEITSCHGDLLASMRIAEPNERTGSDLRRK